MRVITLREKIEWERENVVWLAYNCSEDKYVIEHGLHTEAKPYIIPKGSDPSEGYEAKRIKGNLAYPFFKNKPLKIFDRETHW